MEKTGDSVSRIVMAVFASAETYRLENIALKDMLRDLGLTKRQIQKRLKPYLKDSMARDGAFREWIKATQETLRILDDLPCQKSSKKFPRRRNTS